MNRPTAISVFSDQHRTKSTTWSRTSCGTQVSVRVPQGFFLTQCAPPSARPGPRPWSAPSSPRTQSVSVSPPPGGEDAPSIGTRPLRSRRTLSASGKTPLAAGPALHTDPKPGPYLNDGAAEWPPSPQQCSASALCSYVRSAILTDERFLHFQLRRNTGGKGDYRFHLVRSSFSAPLTSGLITSLCPESRAIIQFRRSQATSLNLGQRFMLNPVIFCGSFIARSVQLNGAEGAPIRF